MMLRKKPVKQTCRLTYWKYVAVALQNQYFPRFSYFYDFNCNDGRINVPSIFIA